VMTAVAVATAIATARTKKA